MQLDSFRCIHVEILCPGEREEQLIDLIDRIRYVDESYFDFLVLG